jgi:ankyrin repeat protein
MVEIVRLLCDRGADVKARDQDGRRPLHYAATYGHISIVKELIEVRNAEINARDDRGRTALRIARDDDNADTAAYLVSHGGIVYDDDDDEI